MEFPLTIKLEILGFSIKQKLCVALPVGIGVVVKEIKTGTLVPKQPLPLTRAP